MMQQHNETGGYMKRRGFLGLCGLLPEQVDKYGLIAEYRKKELMASIAQRKKEYLESESAFENIFK